MLKQPNNTENYTEIIQKIKKNKTKPFHQPFFGILLSFMGIFSIIAVFIIILFLARESMWFTDNPEGFTVIDILFTDDWHPERVLHADGDPTYGALVIILGSLLITIGAMMFAVPFGIGCAIFISEIAPPKLRVYLKTGIELLAGIPSVVYGFFGLRVFVPFLQNIMPKRQILGFTGDSWLAASIILGIMALPTIVSVTEDSLRAVPREYKEASLAMGATKWQTIRRVQVPSAISGITAAVILGMGRAIGETMAVMFVAGNSLTLPPFNSSNWWNSWGILERLRTITATLGIELKEVPFNTPWYGSLFMLGVILFVITLIINTLSSVILKKINERFSPPPKDEDLDRAAMSNISHSVASLPRSVYRKKDMLKHDLDENELIKARLLFKELGETLHRFGIFKIIPGILIILYQFGVLNLIYGTSIFYMYIILASLMVVGELYFTLRLNKKNLEINKLLKYPLFKKYTFSYLISSSISLIGTTLLYIVLPLLTNTSGFLLSTTGELLILAIIVIPLLVEIYSNRELRDFFYVNPFIPKRRAAESSNLMFMGSIFKVFFYIIPYFIPLIGKGMLSLGMQVNSDGITVFSLLLLLTASFAFYILQISGLSRTGRYIAEKEKYQLNKNTSQFLRTVLRIILYSLVVVFGLFTFNWLVVLVAIPLFIFIPILTRKLDQNLVQYIAYGVMIFCASIVVLSLSIIIFNIYKEGMKMLGLSVVILFTIFIVFALGLKLWKIYQPTKEELEKEKKAQKETELEKKRKNELRKAEKLRLKALSKEERKAAKLKLKQQRKILKQEEKQRNKAELERATHKKTAQDIEEKRLKKKETREKWLKEKRPLIDEFKKNILIYLGLVILLVGITVPIIINNGFRWMGERGLGYIFKTMQDSGREGGILNQIIGTSWLVLLSVLIAVPIGIMAGIYLAEYSKEGPVTSVIRAAIDNLNGTPSIVFGLFGMGFFLNYLRINDGERSLIAGVFTMALMVLPTIIRVTDEAIKAVPQGLKEGSYAMGTTKWETIRKVILPVARPSIVTGVILSMGRVAGETAPIMFIAAVFTKTFNPFPVLGDGVQLLPYHVLTLSTEFPGMDEVAGGAALILLLLVVILFSIATKIRTKYSDALK